MNRAISIALLLESAGGTCQRMGEVKEEKEDERDRKKKTAPPKREEKKSSGAVSRYASAGCNGGTRGTYVKER